MGTIDIYNVYKLENMHCEYGVVSEPNVKLHSAKPYPKMHCGYVGFKFRPGGTSYTYKKDDDLEGVLWEGVHTRCGFTSSIDGPCICLHRGRRSFWLTGGEIMHHPDKCKATGPDKVHPEVAKFIKRPSPKGSEVRISDLPVIDLPGMIGPSA